MPITEAIPPRLENRLGRISKASFGFDSDDRYGLHMTLTGNGWGMDWSYLDTDIDHQKIKNLLRDSKKFTVERLVGTPIQVTVEGNVFRDMRILTEVL